MDKQKSFFESFIMYLALQITPNRGILLLSIHGIHRKPLYKLLGKRKRRACVLGDGVVCNAYPKNYLTHSGNPKHLIHAQRPPVRCLLNLQKDQVLGGTIQVSNRTQLLVSKYTRREDGARERWRREMVQW